MAEVLTWQTHNIMEKLMKVERKYYTQNIDELPIEERVFFTEGLVVNKKDFRFATEQEIVAWRQWQQELEEKMNL